LKIVTAGFGSQELPFLRDRKAQDTRLGFRFLNSNCHGPRLRATQVMSVAELAAVG
jgi:hypothetical protein